MEANSDLPPASLRNVDDVERRDRLAAGVLGVRDAVTDHVLEEHLVHATRLPVDEARNALHAATCQAAGRRLLQDGNRKEE